jgi:hypothetical protein
MGYEQTAARRRDTRGTGQTRRQSTDRDQTLPPTTALPMLDWPRDLFSRPEASVRDTADL